MSNYILLYRTSDIGINHTWRLRRKEKKKQIENGQETCDWLLRQSGSTVRTNKQPQPQNTSQKSTWSGTARTMTNQSKCNTVTKRLKNNCVDVQSTTIVCFGFLIWGDFFHITKESYNIELWLLNNYDFEIHPQKCCTLCWRSHRYNCISIRSREYWKYNCKK